MPNFLLLETSTDICSVAWSDGQTVLAQRETRVFHEHGRKLTGFIQSITEEVGMPLSVLDAIGVSQGPGSFTSLRIGIATAKGLAFTLDKPLLVLDAFVGMMAQARKAYPITAGCYLPLIDARSMGVFVGVYDQNGNCKQAVERRKLDQFYLENLLSNEKEIVFCGNAAEKYREHFKDFRIVYAPDILPNAGALQSQALTQWNSHAFADLAYFEPLYIAPPNITQSKKRPPLKRI